MAIKPSLRLALLLLAFHLMAAFVIFETSMPKFAALAVLIVILLSAFYHLGRDALLLFADSWREISLERSSVSVVTNGGVRLSGLVADKTAVSPSFVLLSVRFDGHRLPVFRAILPDALDPGAFRELCVLLRFSPGAVQ